MTSPHIIACTMIALFVVSVAYPWDFSWPAARWLVHLPLLQIPLYILYEVSVSANNIRVDLFLVVPALLVIAMTYLGKLAFLYFVENQELRNAMKQTEHQGGPKLSLRSSGPVVDKE